MRDQAKNQGEVIPAPGVTRGVQQGRRRRQYFLTDLKFTPVIKPNGKSVIRITLPSRCASPTSTSSWSKCCGPMAGLLRELSTLLLDLPMYAPTPVVSSAPRLPVATAPAPRPQTVAPTPRPVTPPASAPVRPVCLAAPAPAAASKIEGISTRPPATRREIAQSSRQRVPCTRRCWRFSTSTRMPSSAATSTA